MVGRWWGGANVVGRLTMRWRPPRPAAGAVPGAVPGAAPEPGAAELPPPLPPCGSRRLVGCCGTAPPVRWGGGPSGIRGKRRSWLAISSLSSSSSPASVASITMTRPFWSTTLHVNTHAQSAQGVRVRVRMRVPQVPKLKCLAA